MRVYSSADAHVSSIAANAAGNPVRVGFEGGPVARATIAPTSLSTTHSVFVPPPSNPKTQFMRKAYAKMRLLECRGGFKFRETRRELENSGTALAKRKQNAGQQWSRPEAREKGKDRECLG
jgi:hypothetical protein